VLRRIFGTKRGKITREWRQLHKVELCNLCSSPNIIMVTRSRRSKWKGYVVAYAWGDEKCIENFSFEETG
jgi:hypothetical protein